MEWPACFFTEEHACLQDTRMESESRHSLFDQTHSLQDLLIHYAYIVGEWQDF